MPEIGGVKNCFTGADFFDKHFWFTCSAEDTQDAYEDGAVKGSMIGLLEVGQDNSSRFMEEKIVLSTLTSFFEEGQLFEGKIESVSVYEKDKEGVYTALAVTDNDGKPSELLLLDIRL